MQETGFFLCRKRAFSLKGTSVPYWGNASGLVSFMPELTMQAVIPVEGNHPSS